MAEIESTAVSLAATQLALRMGAQLSVLVGFERVRVLDVRERWPDTGYRATRQQHHTVSVVLGVETEDLEEIVIALLKQAGIEAVHVGRWDRRFAVAVIVKQEIPL